MNNEVILRWSFQRYFLIIGIEEGVFGTYNMTAVINSTVTTISITKTNSNQGEERSFQGYSPIMGSVEFTV